MVSVNLHISISLCCFLILLRAQAFCCGPEFRHVATYDDVLRRSWRALTFCLGPKHSAVGPSYDELRRITSYCDVLYDVLRRTTTYYDVDGGGPGILPRAQAFCCGPKFRRITTNHDVYDLLRRITTQYDVLRRITTIKIVTTHDVVLRRSWGGQVCSLGPNNLAVGQLGPSILLWTKATTYCDVLRRLAAT